MTMTTEAKAALGKTIRGLREYLLDRLDEETRKAYLLDLPTLQQARRSLDATRLAKRQRLEALGVDRAVLVKQAAYTLINRLVVIRLMEGFELRRTKLVTGGTESRAYRDFRALSPAMAEVDDSEGYALLLDLTFRELAHDLPGLFGRGGAASALELVPVPWFVLREVIKRLDDKALEKCWADDMTLGWVYQFWNDPEREALDAKIAQRKKLEPNEIASKTQMFTERYMVDWLLQNSLGAMWLAMCRKHGWTADCERGGDDGLLSRLDTRRAAWRERRERGEVALIDLMPLESEDEARWAYYVPQPIPDEAVATAPDSLDGLKLLDPAVGSGHFLIVAFDLLMALHQEEDRHRGRSRTLAQIAETILEVNLHGIDLDPRAVQIAAAALWLKARAIPGANPKTMNLVSSQLRLGELAHDDPALDELRVEVFEETGIPAELTDKIIAALKGVDWLGSLLKIEEAVGAAIAEFESKGLFAFGPRGFAKDTEGRPGSVWELLEAFLSVRTGGGDLGLRLRGEQLASGVRLLRMLREGQYDLVVGNPPYQGTAKMKETAYLTRTYPRGKADLYAMFLERGLQLVRPGGVSALLTMRGWMFIKQYAELRKWLVREFDIRSIGDFAIGAFDEVPNDLLSVAVAVIHSAPPRSAVSVAQQPSPPDDRSYDRQRTSRKRAATLAQVGRHEFRASDLQVVPEWPLVYWWPANNFLLYRKHPLIGEICPAREGLGTRNDTRFTRLAFEVRPVDLCLEGSQQTRDASWVPIVMGARGLAWYDPTRTIISWLDGALVLRVWLEFYRERAPGQYYKNEQFYFRNGVAYSTIGHAFAARVHRHASVFGESGSSLFGDSVSRIVCALNASRARSLLQDLNPTISFKAGDLNRLPMFEIAESDAVLEHVRAAFTTHESHREPSVEFREPGPSPWRYAQGWAQRAVDREEGAPLPEYLEELDPEPPTDHLSYALGVALGRFGAGTGILDPQKDDLSQALPHGILFLDGSLADNELTDSLGLPAVAPLMAAWVAYGPKVSKSTVLRDYLREKFFATHKAMYDNRPIHWPLSSSDKLFVVWVNIHRMDEHTLTHVLADHLVPRQTEIQGLLNDLIQARGQADKKAAADADNRYGKLYKVKGELDRFIETLRQLAERGPLRPDPKTPAREVDARYAPDLDDGVMINSAALWPVLEPQWKDPKKWWKELATASGKKDYDWSHLAMRYFPTRVDAKCQKDPSLGVAHGCFWHYHPERAYAWELRLQAEIAPDFRITEAPYRDGPQALGDVALRTRFLTERPQDAISAIEREILRRRRKTKAPILQFELLDEGLWTNHPGALYELELELSKKQGLELLILAPDEPEARDAFESQYPHRASARRTLMSTLKPAELDLTPEDEDTPDPDADPEEEETDET